MPTILKKIVQNKRKELEKRKKEKPLESFLNDLAVAPPTRPFRRAIHKSNGNLALIAEIKKASPSKGLLAKNWEPKKLAALYAENGASAISVVTDQKFFQGDIELIPEIKKICDLPVLRKDFIIDPYQVYESRAYRADAVLLIASLFSKPKDLKKMIQMVNNLSMVPLVEVHTPGDLQKALRAEAEVIGINNRDLANFKVDLKTTSKLVKKIPDGKTIVSESGIFSAKEALPLWKEGVNAILVGEALVKAKPQAPLIRELATVGQNEI